MSHRVKSSDETARTRDGFGDFVNKTRWKLQEFHDLTPTHWNEREEITEVLTHLYQLESLLKNQPKPNEMNEKMTPEEIRDYIDKVYPDVKAFVEGVGMTKEDWIRAAIEGPTVFDTRCENCQLWPCEAIESLKSTYPGFIDIWYSYGCTGCSKFIPKEGNESEED